MKKMILLVTACLFILLLAACNGKGESFNPKVEQEKATAIMNGVLTSFKDQEKMAEAKSSDEANVIAWEKVIEKNKGAISKDLSKKDQKKLLYLVTFNQPKDLGNGETLSNVLFTRNTEIKDVTLDEGNKNFIFDIERSGFDHKIITLESQDGVWKIVTVQDPE